MAVNAEAAALIKSEVAKQLDPFVGLMKTLEGPARKAGTSPQELFGRMSDYGNVPGVVGPDGQFRPAPFAAAQKRSIGWGPMLKDMALISSPADFGANPDDVQKAKTRLFNKAADGGFGVTKAALAEGSGVTGGYTVPPGFSENLLRIATEDAIVGPRSSSIPMTTLQVAVPSLDHTVGAAGQSPFLGGLAASWTSEATTRAESEPTFRQTELKAWELSFYTVASNNLLADNAVGLDTLLTTLFGMAVEWYTEYAYFRGDGVGKPLGMVDATPTVAITRGTASRVRYVDVVTMMSRLLAQSWERAIWAAHPSVFVDLMLMHDSSGSDTNFGYGRKLFASIDGGASKAPPATLLGRPLYWTEKLPVLGTRGDLMLFDPFFYLRGTRMELEIATSQHYRFVNNQMVWRCTWRGDGRPWLHDAITLADGSHTVSPFVVIAA